MKIFVNGEETPVKDGATVACLIAQLRLDARKVAIERNREVAPRSLYAETALQDGDHIEIVHFIGGG